MLKLISELIIFRLVRLREKRMGGDPCHLVVIEAETGNMRQKVAVVRIRENGDDTHIGRQSEIPVQRLPVVHRNFIVDSEDQPVKRLFPV